MRMNTLLLAALLAASCAREPAASADGPAAAAPGAAAEAFQQSNAPKITVKPKRTPEFHFEDPLKVPDDQLGDFHVVMKVAVEGVEAGTIVFDLWPEKAPKTVRNFLRYCDEGFYDGLLFHRILRDFMIQGGSSTNDGSGQGPNGPIKGEFSIDPQWNHRYGVLSMARSPDPDSGSSQFFLCCGESASTAGLNGKYTSFGRMVAGVAALEAVASVPTSANPMTREKSRPLKKAAMLEVRVVKGPAPASEEVIARPPAPVDGPSVIAIQHVLISFAGSQAGGTRSKEEAAALAQAVLERARKGEDFNALVKEYSADPVDPKDPLPGVYRLTVPGYPDPQLYQGVVQRQSMMATLLKETEAKLRAGEITNRQWLTELGKQEAQAGIVAFVQGARSFPRDEMVPAFGDVGFALAVGEFGLAPYDQTASPFGWHVIKRLE
jgi:peptidyl-prolyl cis-trans isomerase B (cyclophilin B)